MPTPKSKENKRGYAHWGLPGVMYTLLSQVYSLKPFSAKHGEHQKVWDRIAETLADEGMTGGVSGKSCSTKFGAVYRDWLAAEKKGVRTSGFEELEDSHRQLLSKIHDDKETAKSAKAVKEQKAKQRAEENVVGGRAVRAMATAGERKWRAATDDLRHRQAQIHEDLDARSNTASGPESDDNCASANASSGGSDSETSVILCDEEGGDGYREANADQKCTSTYSTPAFGSPQSTISAASSKSSGRSGMTTRLSTDQAPGQAATGSGTSTGSVPGAANGTKRSLPKGSKEDNAPAGKRRAPPATGSGQQAASTADRDYDGRAASPDEINGRPTSTVGARKKANVVEMLSQNRLERQADRIEATRRWEQDREDRVRGEQRKLVAMEVQAKKELEMRQQKVEQLAKVADLKKENNELRAKELEAHNKRDELQHKMMMALTGVLQKLTEK